MTAGRPLAISFIGTSVSVEPFDIESCLGLDFRTQDETCLGAYSTGNMLAIDNLSVFTKKGNQSEVKPLGGISELLRNEVFGD